MASSVGSVLLVITRWLILSSAYKSRQSMMVSHRAVVRIDRALEEGVRDSGFKPLNEPEILY